MTVPTQNPSSRLNHAPGPGSAPRSVLVTPPAPAQTQSTPQGNVNPQVGCDLNANDESDEIGEGCNNTNASPNTTLESSPSRPHRRAGLRAETQSLMKRTGQYDAENSMKNFYAMQLRDANKTIETPRNEVTRLRTSNQEQGHHPSRKGDRAQNRKSSTQKQG
ncbi:hypothetical protein VP01_15g1 [Puccinia sorghi]|uniref:Uncharacterized protein n=1 Tax=Puccinia sorghi TaxID=27349 RepID=A0A0L6VHW3_9BASI|nr:hypothetical protein VP01_15g1 [Puccinia sorghi]